MEWTLILLVMEFIFDDDVDLVDRLVNLVWFGMVWMLVDFPRSLWFLDLQVVGKAKLYGLLHGVPTRKKVIWI